MTISLFARGVAAACLVAAAPQAAAETFTLTNGQVIEGTVMRALGNTISIKFEGAGMLQVPIGDVRQVEIAADGGGVVSGRLAAWSDGVYRLSTDQGLVNVRVEDGVAVSIVDQREENPDGRSDVATASPSPPPARDRQVISAGFVVVGTPEDGGRTFMQAKGREALAQNPEVEAVTSVEIESEDADQAIAAVDQLVDGGANLIFLNGNQAAAAVAESAKRHGAVRFIHCGFTNPVANVDVVCGRIYEARYLSGIIAGGMTETDLIGYVAAKPTPDVIVGINAFALGVQSVNPDARVMVRWTNAWYAPGVARQGAEDLVKQGIDLLTIHQDSPAALQIAEQHGIGAIGYQSDMRAFAPTSILTSVVWDWEEIYNQVVDRLHDDILPLRSTWLGLREGAVGLTPISSRVPGELTRLVEQRQREMIEGRFYVFTGPIRDTGGDVRVLDGRIMTDESLQTMDFLVEGVIGFSKRS